VVIALGIVILAIGLISMSEEPPEMKTYNDRLSSSMEVVLKVSSEMDSVLEELG